MILSLWGLEPGVTDAIVLLRVRDKMLFPVSSCAVGREKWNREYYGRKRMDGRIEGEGRTADTITKMS